MVKPPLDAEAVHETEICALPERATTPVGASGIVAGMTAVEAVEAIPEPAEFVAMTVKVYDVPFVKDVTVQFKDPDVAQCLLVS